MPRRARGTDLSTGEVARLLGSSTGTVIRLYRDGHLKGYLVPGSTYRRFKREEVLKFLEANGIPFSPSGNYIG